MDQFADNAANATARLVMRENDLTDNTEMLKAKRMQKSKDFKGPQLIR